MAHNVTRHLGILRIEGRLPSSNNGNPRYSLYVAGFRCRTSVDSSLAYSVPNHDGKQVEATIGTHYGVPTLLSVKAV